MNTNRLLLSGMLGLSAMACEVPNDQAKAIAQQTTEEITQRMIDFCENAPSDVDRVTCTLRRDGEFQLNLTLECPVSAYEGWSARPDVKFLSHEYDALAPGSFDDHPDCWLNGVYND